MKTEYKGCFIVLCEDGTFDIVDVNSDLVDGGYANFSDCTRYIDELENEGMK
jgi:hypothetical protein